MSNAYPYVLAAGALLGLVWLGVFHRQSSPESSIDLGLLALFAGLVGARIAHVAAYWSYYSSRLIEAAQFWQGGLSWAGGAAGSLLALALIGGITKRNFWADADRLAAPALIVGSAGWFGCLLDACAYGQSTPHGPPMPDLLGVVAPRWPTQAIGGVLTLLALVAVYLLSEAKFAPGALAAAALLALGAINLGASFLRGDPTPVIAGLRLDGVAAAAVMLLGGIGLVAKR